MLPLDECKELIYHHNSIGKVALQISGGKDSMATAIYLKPFWGQLTFYWSNPGDPLPETVAIMDRLKQEAPNFVEVRSSVIEDRLHYGFPSEVVPESMTVFETIISNKKPAFYVRHRSECCNKNFYKPMLNKIIEDKVTLIIRGEKHADHHRNYTLTHGAVDALGMVHCYPIYDETSESVVAFLRKNAPEYLHPIYDFDPESGLMDCMGCTAWWEEANMKYLKERHPQVHDRRLFATTEIKKEILATLKILD